MAVPDNLHDGNEAIGAAAQGHLRLLDFAFGAAIATAPGRLRRRVGTNLAIAFGEPVLSKRPPKRNS